MVSKKIRVKTRSRPYDIVLTDDVAKRLKAFLGGSFPGRCIVTITNKTVYKLWHRECPVFENAIFIPDGEDAKDMGVLSNVLEKIAAFDTKRRSVVIVAVGGGVVGDLAGLAAALYKRGVPVVHIPTTLLAQVDSSIGGKTAVNLAAGKNLAGVIYQPYAVFIDIGFLKTLPKAHIIEGLAEVIKYAIIRSPALYNHLASAPSVEEIDWEFVIPECAKIKADVVSYDECETKGLRYILNYGHTIGHAIEAALDYTGISHGRAVALGMVAEAILGEKLGLCSHNLVEKVKNLIGRFDLPCGKVEGVEAKALWRAMDMDKKFGEGRMVFALPVRIGAMKVVRGVDKKFVSDAVKEGLGL